VPGIEDRDAADAMRGTEVWCRASTLPPPAPGEYYWVDLEGLRVVNCEGADFGTVSHLFATGANDVLVAQGDRERMIPFVEPDYIRSRRFRRGRGDGRLGRGLLTPAMRVDIVSLFPGIHRAVRRVRRGRARAGTRPAVAARLESARLRDRQLPSRRRPPRSAAVPAW
jgi:hypothetical protein